MTNLNINEASKDSSQERSSPSSNTDLEEFKKRLKKASTPLIYFILLQGDILYSYGEGINLYFGIGTVLAYILIYIGIVRNNRMAPMVGSILTGIDIILTTVSVFVVNQYIKINIGAIFFAYIVKISLLYTFIRVIRMQGELQILKHNNRDTKG